MKTITFYSYKGGVGRSLALSNVATRLSELKKKVCVLDFDLEAPGLDFKFRAYTKSKSIENGIVDYIYCFSSEGKVPEKIKDYSIQLIPRNTTFKAIDFIPAGNIDSSDYWKNLSAINWAELFYSEKALGVKFFLDLKAKIEKELNPDFLLIDSRTGITDISGITLKIFADDVIVFAANNEENIFGSKKIIKSLQTPSNSLFGNAPKIIFVMTRIPFSEDPKDLSKEYTVIERRKIEFKKYLDVKEFEILVIRSDRRLEEQEQMLIGYELDEKKSSISNDYYKLFEKITSDVLSPSDIKDFQDKKNAEKEFIRAQQTETEAEKLKHLNKAISLNPSDANYYIARGLRFHKQKNLKDAIRDYNKAIELYPNNPIPYNNLGVYEMENKNLENALKYFDKAISINPTYDKAYFNKAKVFYRQKKIRDELKVINQLLEIYPNNWIALNIIADRNRVLGNLKEASTAIKKAIEINSNEPILFGTLAEIKAAEGNIEEFYFNLTVALNNGISGRQLNSAKEVYEKFRIDERFISLMNKYDIDVEEIFAENKE